MSITIIRKRLVTHVNLAIMFTLLALVVGFVYTQNRQVDAAADAKDFDPGRIIDDAVFYNSGSMTASQIQSFLNSKVPNCDTNGTQPASDWGRPDITHATLASYIRNGTNGYVKNTNFHAPPYTCLKDFRQDTPQMEAASGLCESIPARSDRTAARIIYDVANACGINPQVLLVLLNKEQSLVTDSWPLNIQYRNATGFACPDTAPCDPKYNGFFYQVYHAARQFKVYKAYPNSYNYIAGRTNTIYWHPDLSRCGSSRVYIENQATAALYIYTPYRPNSASLSSYPGTGNSCSSYGNRNFWFMFTNWFGSTTTDLKFEPIKVARYLKLKESLRKTNLRTGEPDGALLPKGMEIYFTTRYIYNGELYVRTQSDTNKRLNRGIRYSDLTSVLEIKPMSIPRTMVLKDDVRKTNFRTGDPDGVILKQGMEIFFTDKYTYDGELYLRTESDSDKWLDRGIRMSDLMEKIDIQAMHNPRYMVMNKDVAKTNFRTGDPDGVILKQGMKIYFTESYILNDELYLRTLVDAERRLDRGVRYADLLETLEPSPMKNPRHLRLMESMAKTNFYTREPDGVILRKGMKIYFTDRYTLDGELYVRTEVDTIKGIDRGIRYTDLENI